MPLSEEDVEINTEIVDIMQRVRKMAQDHTRNFHCGAGADDAIAEAGLDKYDVEKQIKVKVDFRIEGLSDDIQTVEYDFDKADLMGKDHESQCDWVSESMSPTLVFGDSQFEVGVKVVVTDLNKVVPPPPRLPRGLVFRKVQEGRVAHVLHPTLNDSLCGGIYVTQWTRRQPEPDAGTAVCKKCKQRTKSRYNLDTGDVV